MLTDYMLAALGLWFGSRILARARGYNESARRNWGSAFLAMALGAALGGTSHGFALVLDAGTKTLIWKATVFSIGLVSYFVLNAMARALWSRRVAGWVQIFAVLKLAAYWWWMASHDEFVYVIADYAPSLLFAMAAGFWLWGKRRAAAGAWIAAGVAVSFVGAGVQMSGFALHPSFNHNDLYHVIQMAGLALLYGGARDLDDA